MSLEQLGLVASSVRDAAGTDGQTARGCQWSYSVVGGDRWTISQVVGNSSSLQEYKSKFAGDDWLPDLVIQHRVVGIVASEDLGECMTYVQSGRAGINTTVMHHSTTHVPVDEVCDRAIAFTKATIDKMPR